ncbi:uncharacterized protein RCC_11391 [Ramularia collo-cygni]|uniref:NAD dependent epimerase/dehydratase n=1 Tax=Ramularia collo-cygni TaxID=112498 RepID=A0A2D3V5Y7_9PEZI|nr:uncharacterized protein RCC_11391 [Ramularia collo-cygni]CZT25722.1 uncharacterized protein RCC_11391 [Ramularia collo-cygni]
MTSLRFQDPKPGSKIRVIGAGLPRTGTNSFCAALQVLLGGPCYHAGVQWGAQGATDEKHIKTMIKAAGKYPYDAATKQSILAELETLLDGYVAVADPPLSLLYPELLELYPDAKVIVTIRDHDSWAKSMTDMFKTTGPVLVGRIFFWLPSVRWLPSLHISLTHIFFQKHGIEMVDKQTCLAAWEKHHAQLEETVPPDQLIYFNVKDGWKPLCEALDLPIPDTPFPRLNDAKDLENHFKKLAARGLARWAFFFVASFFILTSTLLVVDGSICRLDAVHSRHGIFLAVDTCLLLILPALWPFL